MTKLNYVFISLLILVILVGTVYFVVFYEVEEEIPTPPKEEDPIVNAFLANDELMDHIKGLMNECLIEQNTLCMALYEDKEDVSFCNKITSPNKLFDCQSTYYLYKFYLTKDDEMCKKITIPKVKSFCEEFSKNNFKFCEEMSDEDEKSYCSALFKQKISLCDGIKSQNLRLSCKNKINFLYALDKEDIKKCEGIKEETEKKICKAVISQNPLFCKITETSVCYDFDYFNNAYLQIYDINSEILKKLVNYAIEDLK